MCEWTQKISLLKYEKKQQSPLWRSPLNSTHVVLSWFTSDVNVGVTVNERLDVNMQSGAV